MDEQTDTGGYSVIVDKYKNSCLYIMLTATDQTP